MLDQAPVWARWYPDGADPGFAPEETTVNAQFRAFTERFAGRLAIDYKDHEFTFANLRRGAAQVANALRAAGIGPGDVVALYLPNTIFHPFWFYGTLLAGATVTHLSPLDAPRELEHKVADSGACLVVSLTAMAGRAVPLLEATGVGRAVLCDDAEFGGPGGEMPGDARCVGFPDFVAGVPEGLPEDAARPGDRALLQYTGGTTGLPKAAVLTQGNLAASTQLYQHALAHEPDRGEGPALVVSPFFHIMGLCSILLRRMFGGEPIVLHQRFDAERFVSDIERKRIVGASGVPTMWIAIANLAGIEERDLSSLRSIGAGGAPMPVEVAKRITELTGLPFGGGWGMTEIAGTGTWIPASAPEEKRGSIGVPLPGFGLRIVDLEDPRRELPRGEAGEIAVKAPSVTREYHNRPDETEASFADGWFLTGDVGVLDADGFLHLVDRKKDLILSGGYNVYPQAVEQAIFEHEAVAEVMVIGLPDPYRGERAAAYVVLKDGARPFSLEDLRAFLDSRLGRHELPAELHFRESLPRTAVGKYARRALRDEVMKGDAREG